MRERAAKEEPEAKKRRTGSRGSGLSLTSPSPLPEIPFGKRSAEPEMREEPEAVDEDMQKSQKSFLIPKPPASRPGSAKGRFHANIASVPSADIIESKSSCKDILLLVIIRLI